MSRSKKSRRLKSIVSVKTGSKSQLLDQTGKKGQIASKNKLSKHKKRQKSAFIKSQAPSQRTASAPAIKHSNNFKQSTPAKPIEITEDVNKTNRLTREQTQPHITEEAPDFNDLDGEQLLDFFENH